MYSRLCYEAASHSVVANDMTFWVVVVLKIITLHGLFLAPRGEDGGEIDQGYVHWEVNRRKQKMEGRITSLRSASLAE